jgi:DNA modification methylase
MRSRDKARVSKMKATENTCYGNLEDYQGELLEESYPINIIEFDKSGHSNMLLHPTQKPLELMEYLIKTYTNEGMVVFDATMGSGTTGLAAVKNGRKFIGIEKDEKYFEIAVSRVSAYCG